MSVTKVTIRIGADNGGVVVNTNDLTQNERKKKNALTGLLIPQKDAPQPRKKQNSIEKRQNQTVSTKADKSRYKPTNKQVKQMQRETDSYVKQLNKTSLGMIFTSNQILKQQNELLHENQKVINNLVQNKNNEQRNVNTKPISRQQQKQQLKQATNIVNEQIEQIRKIRDQIVQTAKDINNSLSNAKYGKLQISNNLAQMNQNLKNKAENSIKRIDMLSPQNFDLVNKYQNFKIDEYTQSLNYLKRQINEMQKQSQNVERQLKQRVATLQKVKISPQFQAQLLEPYQQDIKKRLESINLEEARRKVFERLGQFDYFKIDNEINAISNDIRQEMGKFQLVCKQYKINVPILRFDQKQIKALDLKLPSILDEYKQSKGIVFKKSDGKEKQRPNFEKQKEKERLLSSKGFTGNLHIKGNVQQIPSKPKDLSNEIQYKKVIKDPYKTIFQTKPPIAQVQKRQIEQNINQSQSPKRTKKQKQQQDFEAYLQNRKNQELQMLYKQKRDQLRQMKQELYDQSTQPIARISLPRRTNLQQRPQILIEDSRINEESKANISKQEDSIGSRIFDPNEGSIKQIGKEVLKNKLKQMLKKPQKPPVAPKQINYQPILPPNSQHQNMNPQAVVPSMNAFAEGFLTVINNTFAEMNKGISSSLQRKRPERRSVQKFSQEQRIKIPFPELQDIPKPPVFNLQFNNLPKQTLPAVPIFPTFSNNFPTGSIGVPVRQYTELDVDVSAVQSYSFIQNDHSDIKSDISNIKSDISRI